MHTAIQLLLSRTFYGNVSAKKHLYFHLDVNKMTSGVYERDIYLSHNKYVHLVHIYPKL